jgi:hypothetical protein
VIDACSAAIFSRNLQLGSRERGTDTPVCCTAQAGRASAERRIPKAAVPGPEVGMAIVLTVFFRSRLLASWRVWLIVEPLRRCALL